VNSRLFGAALLAGLAIRAAALPLPGTRDTIPWKIWSYNAANEGVGRLYGVGGSPPEWRTLTYAGAEGAATYPPLALDELGLAGRVYRRVMGGRFPNTTPLLVAVKAPAALADAAFAALLYFVVRRRLGEGTARWTTIAYWLNPGIVLDGAVLGYLDPQFMLPIAGSLVAAEAGWAGSAGALGAAAILTKPQAAVVAPAVALLLWNAAPPFRRVRAVVVATCGGLAVTAALVWPVFAAGGGPNMIQALGRLAAHNMLSGNACNLWWIVGYVVRALYSIQDYGVWGAFRHETQILQISRFMEVGFPNPRPIGTALVLAAIAWAAWAARRGDDLWLMAALGAFSIHAFETLAAGVHENHLFAAVPLLTIAAAGRRHFAPVLAVVSAIFALNLNMFYGISEDLGYRVPRGLTIIDLSVVVAALNCAALVWHARVFQRECALRPRSGPLQRAPASQAATFRRAQLPRDRARE
jgi:hypothetical protein